MDVIPIENDVWATEDILVDVSSAMLWYVEVF